MLELKTEVQDIQQQIHELTLNVACPYEFAANNTFLTFKWDFEGDEISTNYIHKWGQRLLNEYRAYLEQRFKVVQMNFNSGWGINETFSRVDFPYPLEYGLHVQGDYAFSLLHSETGIHKLQKGEGNTVAECQVEIEVVPEVSTAHFDAHYDYNELWIDVHPTAGVSSPSRIVITDSGVSITHLSTGIKAYSFTECSQLTNKKLADQILIGRLYMHEQNALENPNILREYDLDKNTIRDRRLKKTFAFESHIREALPQIFKETMQNRIDKMS